MSVEFWSAFCSLIVFATTAVAAMRQLRHVRANNEIQALMAMQHVPPAVLQHALAETSRALEQRLREPAYRAELEALGFIDPVCHPEMEVCNWFDSAGTLVKNGLVEENAFNELFGRLVDRSWEFLGPAIAIMRRRRGPTQYQNFEYLVVRYRAWHARHPTGRYPADVPRLPLEDPWPRNGDVARPGVGVV